MTQLKQYNTYTLQYNFLPENCIAENHAALKASLGTRHTQELKSLNRRNSKLKKSKYMEKCCIRQELSEAFFSAPCHLFGSLNHSKVVPTILFVTFKRHFVEKGQPC